MRLGVSTLTLFAVLASAVGCSSRTEAPAPRKRAEAIEDAPAAEETKSRRPLRQFDAQGRLIPSNEYVAGIPLPRGAELVRADELTHVYRIRSPIKSVLSYIGPMMITGNVEQRGKGAVYKRASVRGAEVNPTKVDVSILEVGSNLVRIAVTELPPPAAFIPPPASTKAAARDSWRTLD
jgi:hypothetical protein